MKSVRARELYGKNTKTFDAVLLAKQDMLVIANELSHSGDKAIEDVAPTVVHGNDEAGSSQKSEPQKSKNKKSM